MKKLVFIALTSVCYSLNSYSQDLGYKTTDIGAEYIWVENSPFIGLQAATNAKIHHSFIASLGYKTAYRPITGTHNNEKGDGWGGSLGYRYYFSVIPKGFYIGARGSLWSLGMYRTADPTIPSVNVMIGQPSAEAGFTALFNDIFYTTVFISAGKQFTISSGGDSFGYGKGSVTAAGISAGIRF
jgi:hypothetical protein